MFAEGSRLEVAKEKTSDADVRLDEFGKVIVEEVDETPLFESVED